MLKNPVAITPAQPYFAAVSSQIIKSGKPEPEYKGENSLRYLFAFFVVAEYNTINFSKFNGLG
ncbi:MAG: hypothetical protein ACUVQT_10405 [bacterium]